MKFTREQLQAFGVRMADARSAMKLTREQVGELLTSNASPQQLYNYERGKRAPERAEIVFELEQVLELPSGSLSRCLGFAPLDGAAMPTTEDALASDLRLTTEARAQLLAALRRAAG